MNGKMIDQIKRLGSKGRGGKQGEMRVWNGKQDKGRVRDGRQGSARKGRKGAEQGDCQFNVTCRLILSGKHTSRFF